MQVSYIFVAIAPILAIRLSDSVAIGFIDVVWILLLIYMMRRPRLAFGDSSAIFAVLFLFSTLLTAALNFTLDGANMRDLILLRVVIIFIPFFYALSLPGDVARLYNVTRLFIISGGIAVVLGVILYQLGIQIRTDQQMLWTGSGGGPKVRAGGVFGNSSDYGLFASSWGSICGLLVLAFNPRSKWKLFFLIATISTYGVWISASRSGLIHIFIAYAIGVPFMLKARGWIVALACMILAFPVLVLGLSSISVALPADVAYTLQRLDFLNLSGDSRFYQSIRLVNWGRLIDVGAENWVLGIGYKGIAKMFENQGVFGDNSFISTFVEFGLFSVLFYALFWIFTLEHAVRNFSRSALGPAFLGIVVAELSHTLTLDTFKNWYSTPITLFFFALLIRASPHILKRSPLQVNCNGE